MKIAQHQPDWACNDCGRKYGSWFYTTYTGPLSHLSCYHRDVCSVCQRLAAVTEARDYGYFIPEWQPSFDFDEFPHDLR